MKRVFLILLLFFTSFASVHAERIATFEGMGEGGRPYVIDRGADGTLRGHTAEPFSLTKVVLAGIGIAILAIFNASR